jgi:serine/threonine protein kinase
VSAPAVKPDGARCGSENCLPAGTRLADYEIVEVLGEGGFGIVYLAFDHSLHRHVAIKEYMPSALALRGNDAGVSLRAERHQDTFRLGLKSFINEARFLAQFDHPALVKVHRYWEQNRTAYTAMQYYDGRTVKDIVAHHPEQVDEAWCLRILTNILQALEMLYTMQIVHRDVSPDNIIVQANGDAVLLDFGSARQVIGDMTRGLTVILKPGYAPVEQYAGDASLEQGAYTDIYALAAVMYHAITGQAPASSIARMIQDPLVPLSVLAPPGYSAGFLAAIDQGLAVLAQDRPQTIDAFRARLGIAPGTPPRAPAAPSLPRQPLSAVASEPQPKVPTVRMPVQAAPAASAAAGAAAAASTAPVSAAPAPLPSSVYKKPWLPLAGAALLVLAAAWGLSALLGGGEDTIMLAQQQPRRVEARVPAPAPAPAPAAAAAAAATAASAPASSAADTASSLDPRESVVTPAPAPAAVAEAPAEAAAPARPVKPAIDSATVSFAIKPWGTVTVDGRERGVSPPLKHLTLPVGSHQIKIVNPGFPDHRRVIEVVKGKPLTVDYDFATNK